MLIQNLKFGLSILLLLTGCAHYQAQPIALAALASAHNGHSLDAPCRKASTVNASEFSEIALIAAAQCFNPELARAKAAIQLALANGELARQYPGLALVLNAEYARKAPESSKWLAGFSLDLPLDVGTRKAVRIEAAEQAQVLATLENALAQRAVAGKIGASVDTIRASLGEQELLHTRAQQSQRWLKFVDQQILEGQAERSERLKPQQELLATQAALLNASAAERAARSQLAQALGVPLAQVLNRQLALNIAPKRAAFGVGVDSAKRQAALLARPELLRALGQYQLAELALRLEYAKQYPELRLSPGYIWERGLVKLPLALGALLPPLDGNRSAIAVALAARSLAARELELTQANISAEIDLAFANRDAARSALRLGIQQMELANTELSAAKAAFDAGELDQLGRLSAELHVNDLLLAVHALEVQLQLSVRAVSLALGAVPAIDTQDMD